MAGGLLELKRRIKSITSTQKITKAMGLVATAKFKKVRQRAEKTNPYFEKFQESMNQLASSSEVMESKYFAVNKSDTDLYIVISSNTGLCAGYNTNVFNETLQRIAGKKAKLITVGEKATQFFTKRNYDVLTSFVDFGDSPSFREAVDILRPSIDAFLDGSVKNVYIIYTKFYNPVKMRVEELQVLPFVNNSGKQEERLFEPTPMEVFDYVLPKYLNTMMYCAFVNSIASEISARMSAMDNATKNANDILDALKLAYNRARQGSITQEITEIVGGAEALKS